MSRGAALQALLYRILDAANNKLGHAGLLLLMMIS
jgi:hypothetical protein